MHALNLHDVLRTQRGQGISSRFHLLYLAWMIMLLVILLVTDVWMSELQTYLIASVFGMLSNDTMLILDHISGLLGTLPGTKAIVLALMS